MAAHVATQSNASTVIIVRRGLVALASQFSEHHLPHARDKVVIMSNFKFVFGLGSGTEVTIRPESTFERILLDSEIMF